VDDYEQNKEYEQGREVQSENRESLRHYPKRQRYTYAQENDPHAFGVERIQKDVDDPGKPAFLDFGAFVSSESAVKFAELLVGLAGVVWLRRRLALGLPLLWNVEKGKVAERILPNGFRGVSPGRGNGGRKDHLARRTPSLFACIGTRNPYFLATTLAVEFHLNLTVTYRGS